MEIKRPRSYFANVNQYHRGFFLLCRKGTLQIWKNQEFLGELVLPEEIEEAGTIGDIIITSTSEGTLNAFRLGIL